MYSKEEVESQLLSVASDIDIKNYIGIIVSLDDKGEAKHSGILIGFLGKTYLFHYLPEGVFLEEFELDKLDYKFYVKEITIFHKSLTRAFLTHCKIIKSTAKPNYGFFYAGSYYENGVYHSNDETPQLMTCVGFCINVITGFLEEKAYIEFNDWTASSQSAQDWLDKFLLDFKKTFPEVDESLLRKNLRRIKPSELVCSGFFTDLPVRKIQTDVVKPVVEEIFKSSIMN